MNNLKIELDGISELVDTELILKLYETASSIPKPLGKQQDNAYMSGRLEVPKTYRNQVLYLAGNINGESNSEGRFKDLRIDVTIGYYIPFEDANVKSILMNNNISSDGVGVIETDAANATLTSAMFKNNTDITSFGEFKYFTKANTNPPNLLFMGCSNLSSIDLSNVTTLSSEEFRGTALTNVVLPENVTTIPGNCFSWNGSLLSVSAPGVLVITQRTFDLCSGLTSFSDFSNVTTIGQNAFLDAPLTGVFNAPNLTTLETSAFLGHHFEGIECIGTLSSIPKGGFGHNTAYNTLLYVYLPYECTRLGEGSFARALALTTVKQYDKTISDYQEEETKTFFPNLGKITIFGGYCFRECSALVLTSDDITNATEIGSNAFRQTKITGNISLPHLTSLGAEAFRDCKTLTSIECLGKISSIPSDCFWQDTALQTVKLPYECTSITDHAFHNCSSLTSITQYNKSLDDYAEGESPTFTNISRITSFGTSCFEGCSLLSLTPQEIQNATTIGTYAFKNTLLSGPIDLSNVASIGQSAFENTKITSVINVGSIPNGCFYGCNELTNIIFRPGITVIGGGAFKSTNLSNIILPYGFEEFGTSNSGAVIMGSCNNITYMQFPSTTTIINFWDIYRDGNPVTAYCVVLATTPPNTLRSPNNTAGNGRGWSWGRPERSRWYVPDSVVNVYKENEQWSPIADYIFPISQLETDSPVNWLLYQTNKDYGVSLNQ